MEIIDKSQLVALDSYPDWLFMQIVSQHAKYPSRFRQLTAMWVARVPWSGPFIRPDGEIQRNYIEERFNYRLGRWWVNTNKVDIEDFAKAHPVAIANQMASDDTVNIEALTKLRNRLRFVQHSVPLTLLAAIVLRVANGGTRPSRA